VRKSFSVEFDWSFDLIFIEKGRRRKIKKIHLNYDLQVLMMEK
jgi:hypothetical protein